MTTDVTEHELNAAFAAYLAHIPMPPSPTDSVSRGYARDTLRVVLKAAAQARERYVIVTQPHHTQPPHAAQIERDGYVVTQQLMTAEEAKQFIAETADEVGVISGPTILSPP